MQKIKRRPTQPASGCTRRRRKDYRPDRPSTKAPARRVRVWNGMLALLEMQAAQDAYERRSP